MQITTSNKKTPLLFLVLPALLAFGLAIYRLDYFGLEYDELIFANAALGDLDGATFVQKKWGDIVFIVFNYIGALKSWLYIPIFKIFEANVWGIRSPVIGLMLLNLALIYLITLKYFNRTVAYAVFLFLSVDLTFITLHRFDKGPSAIETSIKLLILLVILKQENFNKYLSIILLMALGVFNKLNFLWLINGFYGSLFLMEMRTVTDFLRGRLRMKDFIDSLLGRYTIIFIILFTGYIAYVKFLGLHPAPPPTTFGEIKYLFITQLKLLKFTIVGTRIFHLFGWDFQSDPLQTFGSVLFLSTLVGNIILYVEKLVPYRSFHTANGFLILLLFLQIVITREAVNAWHSFVLYPFIIIFMANTLYLLMEAYFRLPEVWIGIVATWLIFNLYLQFKFIEISTSECVSGEMFIPQMKDLVGYIDSRPESKVLSVSWGVNTPLLITGDRKKKYLEPYHATFSPKSLRNWLDTHYTDLKNPDDVLLVNYVMEQTPVYGKNYIVTNDSSFRRYERMVLARGQQPFLFHVIKNQCGKPVYHVYKMRGTAKSPVMPKHLFARKTDQDNRSLQTARRGMIELRP